MEKIKIGDRMKRILITGAGSYIGTSVERYLQEWNAENGRELYRIDTLSLREESWVNYDFSCYDTIFHVVGKAHADIEAVSEETKKEYYRVNCELAVQTACKAKKQKVKQFIYISSIIVYGDSAFIGKRKHITKETKPAPANFYGDSKWQAEKKLRPLASDDFQVAILRPPMIYGKQSKGNYAVLAKLAERTKIFPKIENQRSMLYIENLAEFVRQLIESGKGGLFFPQNKEYTTTSQMVQMIAKEKEKKVILCKVLNPFVYLAARIPGKIGGMARKAFGSLTIEQTLSCAEIKDYQRYSLEESIYRTEK